METNNKTIQFRRKFGNYANPSFRKIVKQDACSGVHSACREENRHKVGIYVQLLQAGNMKSGYLRIFNALTRAITRDLTREFFLNKFFWG